MRTTHNRSPAPAAPAVIFDLDGTLVDSEPLYYEAGRLTLAEHGVEGFTWAEHTHFIGVGTKETLRTLRERHDIEASVEELLAAKNDFYLRLAATATEVFPHMRKLVETLHCEGHPLAVASGSSRAAIDAVLAAAGLEAPFPVRVSAEEVAHGKPAPDVFLAAARSLDQRPGRCVVVEDSPPGVRAAQRAGMHCVAVPYVAGTADDPAFAAAGLLFAEGQEAFDVERAHTWMHERASESAGHDGTTRH